MIANRKGKPYTRDGFQCQWQRVMKRAFPAKADRFTFHDIRAKNLSDAASLEEARERSTRMRGSRSRFIAGYRKQQPSWILDTWTFY